MTNNWNDPNAPQGDNPQNQGWGDQPQQPGDAWNQGQPSADQPQGGNAWDAPQQPQDGAWGQQAQPGQPQPGAWGQQPQPGQPYSAAGGYYDTTPVEGVGPHGYPLASWDKRALGALIDIVIPSLVIGFIWFAIVLLAGAAESVTGGTFSIQNNLSNLLTWLILALGLAALQGATGQTPGRKIAKTQLVDENGVPPTFGKNVLRTLLHIIDNYICCIGFLFPLWDKQRQTIADKIMKTFVIDVSQRGPINGPQQ